MYAIRINLAQKYKIQFFATNGRLDKYGFWCTDDSVGGTTPSNSLSSQHDQQHHFDVCR